MRQMCSTREALDEIGRRMFGEQWSGREPDIRFPLQTRVQGFEAQRNYQRHLYEELAELHPDKREKWSADLKERLASLDEAEEEEQSLLDERRESMASHVERATEAHKHLLGLLHDAKVQAYRRKNSNIGDHKPIDHDLWPNPQEFDFNVPNFSETGLRFNFSSGRAYFSREDIIQGFRHENGFELRIDRVTFEAQLASLPEADGDGKGKRNRSRPPTQLNRALSAFSALYPEKIKPPSTGPKRLVSQIIEHDGQGKISVDTVGRAAKKYFKP